jgi:hypothetical protein
MKKSGLCTFCLKHSAELECYGRGGLSKPNCARPGCDGEHTPGVHPLMGEDDAEVNLVAGDGDEAGDEDETVDEYEYEYEDEHEDGHEFECEYEGLWVGTIGATEVLKRTGESSDIADGRGPAQGANQDKVKGEGRAGQDHDFQADKCSEGEETGDEQWDLGMDQLNQWADGTRNPLQGPFRRPPGGQARPPRREGTSRPGVGARSRETTDQQWEEARHSAWLRQLLTL